MPSFQAFRMKERLAIVHYLLNMPLNIKSPRLSVNTAQHFISDIRGFGLNSPLCK